MGIATVCVRVAVTSNDVGDVTFTNRGECQAVVADHGGDAAVTACGYQSTSATAGVADADGNDLETDVSRGLPDAPARRAAIEPLPTAHGQWCRLVEKHAKASLS